MHKDSQPPVVLSNGDGHRDRSLVDRVFTATTLQSGRDLLESLEGLRLSADNEDLDDPVLITCRQAPRTCWHAVSPPAAEALMTTDYYGMTAEQHASLLKRADAGLLWFDLTWTPGKPPEQE